jgi:nucleoid-associated protein YgaU
MPSASQLDPTPASPQRATPSSVICQRICKIVFSTALITSVATFIAPLATAQDLGEIARQERAKKQNNPAPPATHVYTNEDVKREEILTPEDKARFSATTQPAAVKPPQSATQLATESTPPGNADRPIGARPSIPIPSTAPNATSAPSRNSVRQSAAQKTNQIPAPKNISSAPTIRAKTGASPTTRAYISAASTTDAKSVPAPSMQPTPIPVAAANPVAQIASAITDAPTPATVPLDQMPLGDVARYYRARKRQLALANAQIDPGPVNAPSSPTLATTSPATTPLNQMPLGDVARYYRAKKREEDAAIASAAASTPETNPVPSFSAAPARVQTAPSQSATARPSKVSSSPYPLAIATMPLASVKPAPTRAPRPHPSSIRPTAHRTIARNSIAISSIASQPISRPTTSHPLVAPKRSVGGQATSIRISSGDTLWQLARKYLGAGTRWHELTSLNPNIQDPHRLQIGAQLVLHPSSA